MPKVVTGAGLQEFIETGKHDTIESKKPEKKAEAPPLEVKKEVPVIDVKPLEAESKPEVNDEGLEPEDKDLSEIIRKKIGKKHRAMKEAQEAAHDAETFAKNQYDRARLAEERAATLERELQEAKKAPPKEPELKSPDIKDFTDEKGNVTWVSQRDSEGKVVKLGYTEAVADYASKTAITEDRARQAQAREAAEKAESARKFKEQADKIEGFEEKLRGVNVWFPNAVLEYITESDDGPQIAVYLADNPEAADRISKLRPIKAIAEIGKLVKGFQRPTEPPKPAPVAPQVAERGGAPPPITPVSGTGSGTVQTDPAKMSFRELREYERSKRKR